MNLQKFFLAVNNLLTITTLFKPSYPLFQFHWYKTWRVANYVSQHMVKILNKGSWFAVLQHTYTKLASCFDIRSVNLKFQNQKHDLPNATTNTMGTQNTKNK